MSCELATITGRATTLLQRKGLIMKAFFRISIVLACTAAAVSAYAQPPVAAVYKTNCAPCHGVAGDANTGAGKVFKVPPFSADSVLKESDTDLLTVAKNGKGKMPAWHDKLSDDQLKDLIAFIHTMQKKP
jgi:mono/diheme cytochrome c family protein